MAGPIKIAILADARQAQAAFLRVSGAADSMGAKVARTGSKLTRSLTLPIVAIGAASIKMSTDFNASMTKIQTQAGASAHDVQVLSKEVLDLAAKSQQGPQELADSLFHLKSVGLDNAKAMRALAASTKLAAVGGADLEETTNAIAGAWRTGIKGAGNFSHTVATLNAVIGAGNMRMGDLNEALGTGFLASAKTFGLSLSDVGAALALFTDEGIPANVAATRLRMSFSLLGAPSEKAAKLLATIGISSDRLAHELRDNGIVGAIGLLKDHLQGLSKVKQSQLLSRAFGGGRSSTAILSLINNFDVLKQKEKQVTDGMGKFGAAAAKQAKTPQAQFKLLLSTLEVLAVKIGDELLPDAIKTAQALNEFFVSISKLPTPVKEVGGGLALMAAVMGPLLLVSGALIRSFIAVSASVTALGEASIGTRIQLAGLSIMENRLRFGAGIAGLAALTASTQTSNKALSGLLQVGGGIATGFAVGGPLGAVLGGAAGAFTILAQHMHDASSTAKTSAANYSSLGTTLDDLTGSVTANTRKFIENQLARSGTLKNLATFGITTRTAISAILGEGNARKVVSAAIKGQVQDYKSLNRQINAVRNAPPQPGEAVTGDGTLGPRAQAARLAVIKSLQARAAAEKIVINAVRSGIGTTKASIAAKQADIAATSDYTGKLRGIPRLAKTDIQANGILPTTKAIAILTKRYGLTPKQVRTLISASGVDTTVKQVKKVTDGLKGVSRARPDLSGFKASLGAQIDQAGGIAHSGGTSVGNAIGSGVNAGLSGWFTSIGNTAASVVNHAIAAARKAADAHSPSRKMMRLGEDMGAGLAGGIDKSRAKVLRSTQGLPIQTFASVRSSGNLHAARALAADKASTRQFDHLFHERQSVERTVERLPRSVILEVDGRQMKAYVRDHSQAVYEQNQQWERAQSGG